MPKLMLRLKSKNIGLGKRRKNDGKRKKSKRKNPHLAQDQEVPQCQGQNLNQTLNHHKNC